ncbi:nitronate monooxygenase [Spirilliplanes yamanashiensis]|uniref:Propionate 3-nitronate monooxygenase n=1 Tax=Spirilliplanes yamanashiensis TaxID=42233 RepID=A0A8J3Y5P3_9ACTN|nr:nitronate monooxygenase [Spirilliplanes yamanashiensis]MDP9814646.1 nitronate monooxygenase [Spirilliplanes yamanashiensis]GIJ02301.1 oxidoreductase [Spirilliplanes yamanashiensis]
MFDRPVIVAPMAGGPTTTALIHAAARAGSLAFLPAGYRSVDAVAADIAALTAAGVPYGLNLFVPDQPPADIKAVERYRDTLRAEGERYGVELPPVRPHDDDAFAAKAELALDVRPPFVSFTFGVPPAALVGDLRAGGSVVLVTVTGADEARAAVAGGADVLVVQGGEAGGHAGTADPGGYTGLRGVVDVLREVRAVVDVPLVGAGGVGTAADVARIVAGGAVAVQVGTRFLAADEAGTRAPHLDALLADGAGGRGTVVTRAFTGRPARALRNRFTDAYSAVAPLGYPAVHHLTAPIRAAAARAGDAEALNLWAGTGYAHVRRGTTAAILDELDPRG